MNPTHKIVDWETGALYWNMHLKIRGGSFQSWDSFHR